LGLATPSLSGRRGTAIFTSEFQHPPGHPPWRSRRGSTRASAAIPSSRACAFPTRSSRTAPSSRSRACPRPERALAAGGRARAAGAAPRSHRPTRRSSIRVSGPTTTGPPGSTTAASAVCSALRTCDGSEVASSPSGAGRVRSCESVGTRPGRAAFPARRSGCIRSRGDALSPAESWEATGRGGGDDKGSGCRGAAGHGPASPLTKAAKVSGDSPTAKGPRSLLRSEACAARSLSLFLILHAGAIVL
jgi:hypothetical protein